MSSAMFGLLKFRLMFSESLSMRMEILLEYEKHQRWRKWSSTKGVPRSVLINGAWRWTLFVCCRGFFSWYCTVSDRQQRNLTEHQVMCKNPERPLRDLRIERTRGPFYPPEIHLLSTCPCCSRMDVP